MFRGQAEPVAACAPLSAFMHVCRACAMSFSLIPFFLFSHVFIYRIYDSFFVSTPDILMFSTALVRVLVLPPYGSVADMLACSLIGLHAPETLNPVIHK